MKSLVSPKRAFIFATVSRMFLPSVENVELRLMISLTTFGFMLKYRHTGAESVAEIRDLTEILPHSNSNTSKDGKPRISSP